MKKEEKTKERITINMLFTGPLAERLKAVKEYYQVETHADTIRLLITLAYERIKPFGREEAPKRNSEKTDLSD